MKFTILGSGTGVPRLERGAPGYFLEFGHFTALLDAGPGTLQRLLKAGGDYRKLNAFFLTHTHPDHVSDFIPLLFALKYTPDFQRKAPLTVFGPPGLQDFLNQAVLLFGKWIENLPFELRLVETKEGSFSLGELSIQMAAMAHSVPTVGYRFTDSSRHSAVFSGDTDVTPTLIELAGGSDWLVIECSFPDDQKVAGHLTPSEAGQIAAQAGVKKVILTHLYPPCDVIDPRPSVRAHFHGQVLVARDGMVIELT